MPCTLTCGIWAHKKAMLQIIQIGLPATWQSTVFSLSNVVIQSAINSFGSTAGPETLPHPTSRAFHLHRHECLCAGGRDLYQPERGCPPVRQPRIASCNCLLCVTVVGLFLGCGAYFGGEVLLHSTHG